MIYLFIVANIIAGLLLLITINAKNFPLRRLGLVGKVGVWLGGSGLIVQSMRSLYSDFVGVAPFDGLPIWMIKDVGYWFLAVSFLIAYIHRNK